MDHNSERFSSKKEYSWTDASSANSVISDSNPFHFDLVIFTIDYFELGCFKLPAISNWFYVSLGLKSIPFISNSNGIVER